MGFRRFAAVASAIAIGSLLVASAAAGRPEPSPAAAAPATAKPEIGDFGFDTAGMDRSIDPADDFFGYASGNWAKRTPIPADRIVLTASTSEAYSLLFKLLCDAGDEVLRGGPARGGAPRSTRAPRSRTKSPRRRPPGRVCRALFRAGKPEGLCGSACLSVAPKPA